MTLFEDLTAQQIDWLTSKASLTKRLRTLTHDRIALNKLYDDWGIIGENETAWIRKIEWKYFDAVWIASTVIIPETSITEDTIELTMIGEKSIGDILFKDPTLTRSDFTFSKIDNGFLRQSTFYYKNKPLIIAEYFYDVFFKQI